MPYLNLTTFVSTHSRAEAAASSVSQPKTSMLGFNTQPRGGGCLVGGILIGAAAVSTHSRAEAAAKMSTIFELNDQVSTHSRAEAAAFFYGCTVIMGVFQHTAARRRLHIFLLALRCVVMFQHTAARRRLLGIKRKGLKH